MMPVSRAGMRGSLGNTLEPTWNFQLAPSKLKDLTWFIDPVTNNTAYYRVNRGCARPSNLAAEISCVVLMEFFILSGRHSETFDCGKAMDPRKLVSTNEQRKTTSPDFPNASSRNLEVFNCFQSTSQRSSVAPFFITLSHGDVSHPRVIVLKLTGSSKPKR